jgi:ABC-type amino acid transport system permease subunit
VPFYFLWQLPISIVGAIMLGVSLQVENSYLLSAIDTSARTFGILFGYEYFDLVGAGVLATITVAGFGVITACIAGFTAILWGLHPLSGNAAGTKTTTFIVGVVGACIPFINMFPWIVFWILIMMRHPK